LTTYYRRVALAIFAKPRSWAGNLHARLLGIPSGYRHFNSLAPEFYSLFSSYRASSLNNHVVDFERLRPYRATHFVRDPRDLVVSGYFYHRRGAEAWCRTGWPDEDAWRVVNGTVPDSLPPGMSFAEYLSSCSEEEGLMAEIEFRKKHFDAMEAWDYSNPRCLELRYEDVIGNERAAFARMFDHCGLGRDEISRGLDAAEATSAARISTRRTRISTGHIRDPKPGQWERMFTPRVMESFDSRHPNLLARLGYR